jgi:thiol-disulfide isomerase/thioredoxin
MNKKNILLAILVVAIIGVIVWLEAMKPHQGPTVTAQQAALAGDVSSTIDTASNTSSSSPTGNNFAIPGVKPVTPAQFLASRASIVKQESTQYTAAPEITNPSGFLNTQPFTLASLIGRKVVLVDFWTYSCINCIRTIPYLNAWYAKYKDAGLEIIGVHSPEFQFEDNETNVANAIKQLGIQYPVVLDDDMGTWDAYQNLYWPAEYLINVDGFIVHTNLGEGNYNETESAIQSALAQRDEALGIPTSTIPTGFVNPSNAIGIDYQAIQSPETYFGADRNQYLANGPSLTNGEYNLVAPTTTTSNALYLGGAWNFEDQYATNQNAGATITYKYDAKNVYMVAAAALPITLKITLDGQPAGTVTVQVNQLYNIIQGANYGEHTLQITVENPGLQAYTFTFG